MLYLLVAETNLKQVGVRWMTGGWEGPLSVDAQLCFYRTILETHLILLLHVNKWEGRTGVSVTTQNSHILSFMLTGCSNMTLQQFQAGYFPGMSISLQGAMGKKPKSSLQSTVLPEI